MNTAAITGTIATQPIHRMRGFVPTTRFDVAVCFARRTSTFHVVALNELARPARRWVPGDHVAITGYLYAEPHDMPDGTVWHVVKIIAYEINHHPAAGRSIEVAR